MPYLAITHTLLFFCLVYSDSESVPRSAGEVSLFPVPAAHPAAADPEAHGAVGTPAQV